MNQAIPTIQSYMTLSPLSIAGDQTIAAAATMMLECRIRHLPVLKGDRLLGIITDRDIKFIEALSTIDSTRLAVADAMTDHPYSVTPDTALDEVVSTMAEHKIGSAVVMKDGKVVGIFTTVDACRAFADLLRARRAS